MSAMRYFSPANQKVSPSTTQLRPPPAEQSPKRAERGSTAAVRADRAAKAAGGAPAICSTASVPTKPTAASKHRQMVTQGHRVTVRVALGGRRILKKELKV